MAQKIRWGIMGCGGIANKYANDLTLTKHGEVIAVGSRSKAKAQKPNSNNCHRRIIKAGRNNRSAHFPIFLEEEVGRVL